MSSRSTRHPRAHTRPVFWAVAALVTVAAAGALAAARPAASAPRADAGLAGRIVYTRALGEWPWDIFVSDATGDNELQVTTDDEIEYDPRLSPDGSEIAYHVSRAPLPVPVLRKPAIGGTPTPVVVDDGRGLYAGYPAWSPTGDCLSFAGDHPSLDGRSDLKIWCQDGTKRTVRVTDDRDESSSDWSPDGASLVVESLPVAETGSDKSYWDLYVVSADGTQYDPLVTNDNWSDCDPRWSPDGSRIAYVAYYGRNCAGRGTLRTLDLTTRETTDWILLVAGPPTWSPDGTRLMVSGIVEEGPQPGPGVTPPPTPLPAASQQKGIYWVDLGTGQMGRLSGAAGGVAGGGRYAWGFGPDWRAGPSTPTPTDTVTPTPTSTPTATSTATATPVRLRLWLPVAQRLAPLAALSPTPVPSESSSPEPGTPTSPTAPTSAAGSRTPVPPTLAAAP